MLPDGITVEVIVVNQVNAGHLFVQQHTHPTFHALRSLDQQMYLCYSQPGIPTLPTPVESKCCPGVSGEPWPGHGERFWGWPVLPLVLTQEEAVLGSFMGTASLSACQQDGVIVGWVTQRAQWKRSSHWLTESRGVGVEF